MSQFYRTGGLFSGLGGFFKGVANVVTAPARLALGAVGKTAGSIIGGVIKSTGLSSINIPGIGGLQFGQGPGAGVPGSGAMLPGGQQVAQEKKASILPWILGGAGALGAIYFITRKK